MLLKQQLDRTNQKRFDFEFKEGQLVLYNLLLKHKHLFVNTSGKAFPSWSLSQRVTKVKSPTVASIRDLITQNIREAHTMQCQLILPPQFPEQVDEWVQVLFMDSINFFDPKISISS